MNEQLSGLIADVREGSFSAQSAAIKKLENMSSSSQNRLLILADIPLLEHLISFLANETIPNSFKCSVLGLLCNLSTEQDSHIVLTTEDTLTKLVVFLSIATETKILRRTVGILSNLMINYSVKDFLGSETTFTYLINALSSDDSKLQNNAICALWRLLESHYANQAKFVLHKLDDRLSHLPLSSINQQYYRDAISKLCSLFLHEEKISLGDKIDETRWSELYKGNWRDQVVAIKRAKGSAMPETVAQSTLHEAKILKTLSHPNVIAFYKLIPVESQPVMIMMEYANNGALSDLLYTPSIPISWQLRLKIALGLAEGLSYIHSRNVIHGDIKSFNVLLDQEYRPKWCDFGFSALRKHSINTSQILFEQATTASQAPGTLRWMAPELFQRRGDLRGRKADVYAIGMVFFEIASRTLPFADASDEDLIKDWIQRYEGESVPDQCQRLFPFFAETMKACWHKDPSQRPTAGNIVEQLQRIDTI